MTFKYKTIIRDFRKGMEQIQADADKKIEKIEKFKGSSGYESEKAKIEEERLVKVRELQAAKRLEVNRIFEKMKSNIEGSDLMLPDDKEVRLLQVLQMKTTITEDEAQKASAIVKNNPLASSVFNEFMDKQGIGYSKYKINHISQSDALGYLDNMRRFTNDILSMTKTNNRQGFLQDRKENPAGRGMRNFQLDRDFEDTDELIGIAGELPSDDAISEFRLFADGEL